MGSLRRKSCSCLDGLQRCFGVVSSLEALPWRIPHRVLVTADIVVAGTSFNISCDHTGPLQGQVVGDVSVSVGVTPVPHVYLLKCFGSRELRWSQSCYVRTSDKLSNDDTLQLSPLVLFYGGHGRGREDIGTEAEVCIGKSELLGHIYATSLAMITQLWTSFGCFDV